MAGRKTGRKGGQRRNGNARKLGIWSQYLDKRFAAVRILNTNLEQSIEERGGRDALSRIELEALGNGWKLFFRTDLLFKDFLEHLAKGKPYPKWKDDRLRNWLALTLKFADRYGDRKLKDAAVPTLESIAARAAQPPIPTTATPVNGKDEEDKPQ